MDLDAGGVGQYAVTVAITRGATIMMSAVRDTGISVSGACFHGASLVVDTPVEYLVIKNMS